MPALRRWMKLSRAEKRLLLAAAWWVVLFRTALWTLPLRLVMGLSRRAATPQTGLLDDEIIPLVHRAVQRASRFMPRATCLTRSLSIHTMLGRRGITTQLRIGVAKDEAGRLMAHAWLERDGAKLLPNEEVEKYLAFPAIDLFAKGLSRPGSSASSK